MDFEGLNGLIELGHQVVLPKFKFSNLSTCGLGRLKDSVIHTIRAGRKFVDAGRKLRGLCVKNRLKASCGKNVNSMAVIFVGLLFLYICVISMYFASSTACSCVVEGTKFLNYPRILGSMLKFVPFEWGFHMMYTMEREIHVRISHF